MEKSLAVRVTSQRRMEERLRLRRGARKKSPVEKALGLAFYTERGEQRDNVRALDFDAEILGKIAQRPALRFRIAAQFAGGHLQRFFRTGPDQLDRFRQRADEAHH